MTGDELAKVREAQGSEEQRIVAAQDDAYHNEPLTQVVASDSSFLPQAQQVIALLKAGNVYVGAQPTGIADITIVVGKDFKGI